MSKLCPKCGSEISDGAEKCPSCGEEITVSKALAENTEGTEKETVSKNVGVSLEKSAEDKPADEQPAGVKDEDVPPAGAQSEDVQPDGAQTADAQAAKKGMDTKTVIAIAAAGGLFILLLIIIAAVTLSGGYKKPLDNLFDAVEKNKPKLMMQAMPKFMEDYLDDNNLDDDFEDMVEELNDRLKEEYGKNFNITYKVIRKKKVDKDDLEDMKDYIKRIYKERVKVTDGYDLKIEMKIEGKRGSDKNTTKLSVYKVDGRWSLVDVTGVI